MLDSYVRDAANRDGRSKQALTQLRHDHTEAEAGIARLLLLVEKGLMDAEDPAMRERLIALKLQRDELAAEIAGLHRRLASVEPTITPEKIGKLAILLRGKLYDGPPELRQAYARLVMNEV